MHRQFRLRQQADFARLRREGRVKRHPLLMLSYAPNTCGHNRYGFITSKRLGSAVLRNRIRRQVREAVRLLHPHLSPGYDLVWIARDAIVGKPYQEISRTVNELCERAGLLTSDR